MTPAELAALHARCFTVPRPFTQPEFTALLAAPGVFLVADDGGFALGRVIADEAELLTIAVAPEHRRKGVGAALLAGFESRAQAQGASEAFLEVDERNCAAQALYQKAGYATAGRRRGYYAHAGGASDALILRKAL